MVSQAASTLAVGKLVLFLESSGRSKRTVQAYRSYAWRFMRSVSHEQEPTADELRQFMAKLSKSLRPQSLEVVQDVLRALYRANEWHFPLGKSDLPRVGQVNQPVLSRQDVRRMIQATRNFGDGEQKACLVLSTIYGLRRAEISQMCATDIGENTIFIRTLKRGVQRQHLVPSLVQRYLLDHDWRGCGLTKAWYIFHEICNLAGIRVPRGGNWHSIRRALATCLIENGASEINVARFLRWKISSGGGFGVLPAYVRISDDKVDEAIFAVHPFLSYWEL